MMMALNATRTAVRPAVCFGEKKADKKVVTPEQEAMDKHYAAKGQAAKLGQYLMSTFVVYAGSAFSLGVMLPHFMRPDFYTIRGDIRMSRKKYAEAEADYLKALSLEEARSIKNAPSIRYALKRLAKACEAQNKLPEAEQYRQRAAVYESLLI